MEPTTNPGITPNLTEDSLVNHQALIKEVMKMRSLSLEEKEGVLDVLAEIMGYQGSCDAAMEEEAPVDPNLKPLDQTTSQVVNKNGKQVLEVSGNGKQFEIRGYKAQLPGERNAVIRYRLSTDGQSEPVPGFGSKSQKFGHTKDKIVEKLRQYLGNSAEKAIQDFAQYDASFYQSQG